MDNEPEKRSRVGRVLIGGEEWFRVIYESLEYDFRDIVMAVEFGTACARDYRKQLMTGETH